MAEVCNDLCNSPDPWLCCVRRRHYLIALLVVSRAVDAGHVADTDGGLTTRQYSALRRTLASMAHLLCASLSEPFAIDANAESALPPFLLRTRLSTESLLGATRFVPNSTEEALTATFASWNLLDAIMYQHMPDSPFQTGYLRELQLRRMIELVREPHVRTYVEVGMNGGHSLMAMLLANPRLHADVFDLFKWKYSWSAASLINATFPGRATLGVLILLTGLRPETGDESPHSGFADRRYAEP